jgi:hypothetical protein
MKKTIRPTGYFKPANYQPTNAMRGDLILNVDLDPSQKVEDKRVS